MSQRVGLVHDYLLVMRGAERTFATMAECWPEAPVFTLLYDKHGTGGAFDGRDVTTSYLQRLRIGQNGFRSLLPLFPRAAERLDVDAFDLVVSSSSAFAHGIHARPGAVHICYCHAPFRYAWHERDHAVEQVPRLLRPAVGLSLGHIRRWDRRVSSGVTRYIANSKLGQELIAEAYGREATVIHPPVEVDRFSVGQPEDFLLFVGEIISHKRIDLAIQAARLAGAPLKIVGTGPQSGQLSALYGEHVEFLGRVDDEEIARLYGRARALIVPNMEEFGIAAVEAQAAGRPVVALDRGGTAETVIDGETGVLVHEQTASAFAEAISNTDFDRFDPSRIRDHAVSRFSKERFKAELAAEVERISAAADPDERPRAATSRP